MPYAAAGMAKSAVALAAGVLAFVVTAGRRFVQTAAGQLLSRGDDHAG